MGHAVQVRGLSVSTGGGVRLVDDISFALDEAERVALVGASGSGKSLTAAAVLGTLPVTLNASGSIKVCGGDVRPGRLPRSRTGVAAVHQDPSTALNPLRRVGDQLGRLRHRPVVDQRPDRHPVFGAASGLECFDPFGDPAGELFSHR